VRDLFPILKRYTYLNAAASSPLASPVADAAIEHLRESEQTGDIGFQRWLDFKEQLRARLAKFVGGKTSEVGFVPSTSMAVHLAGSLLKARGVREVLTLDAEFPSTTVPLLNLGLTLRVVKAEPDGTYPLQKIEAAIAASTEAVALSAVQYASGFAIDLPGLKKICARRSLPLVLNVAQALGQIPIEVSGVDFLCGTSHKWMMAGYGTGIFFAREGWLSNGLPWAGWFSPPDELRWQNFPGTQWDGPLARGLTTRPTVAALEAGGGHWPALFSFGAALSLLENFGVEKIHAHNLKLQKRLREGLQERGLRPNAPLSTGICVVPLGRDPMETTRALLKDNVVVTARGGGVRFSTHAFNDESDIARALEAIDRLQAGRA
jgi:cysteine desulfurase/selenocysteine lyase